MSRIDSQRTDDAIDLRDEVAPHPRDPGELSPVGQLVKSDPEAELLGVEPVTALESSNVRADVIDDVLVLGMVVFGEKQVVLAEDPRGHPAQESTHFGRGDFVEHRGQGAGRSLASELAEDRTHEATESGDVGLGPIGSVDDSGASRSAGGAEAGLDRDQLLGLDGGLHEVGFEAGPVVGTGGDTRSPIRPATFAASAQSTISAIEDCLSAWAEERGGRSPCGRSPLRG